MYRISIYLINNLHEVDSNRATLEIVVVHGVVNKHRDFLGTNFTGTITKHKQDGIQHVAFTTAIGTNNGAHALEHHKIHCNKCWNYYLTF